MKPLPTLVPQTSAVEVSTLHHPCPCSTKKPVPGGNTKWGHWGNSAVRQHRHPCSVAVIQDFIQIISLNPWTISKGLNSKERCCLGIYTLFPPVKETPTKSLDNTLVLHSSSPIYKNEKGNGSSLSWASWDHSCTRKGLIERGQDPG